MAEEQKPTPDRPRVPMRALMIAGPVAAIAVAMWVIFGAGGGKDAKAPEPADAAEPAQLANNDDQTVSVQSLPGSVVTPKVQFEDQMISFTATFPDAPPGDPVIAALRKDAESYLATKKAEVKAQYDEAKKAKGAWLQPWTFDISWKYTARSGDVVSLFGLSSEYEGGAHPLDRLDTFIGRTTGEKLKFDDMLVLKRSPSPAMMVAMCEALKVAKKTKIDEETILGDPIVCTGAKANANLDQAKIALAPSGEKDKFGGVYAYFEPYVVGAYVEGDYRIAIQQKIFAEDLKPEFKPLFAGEAPPIEN